VWIAGQGCMGLAVRPDWQEDTGGQLPEGGTESQVSMICQVNKFDEISENRTNNVNLYG